MKKYEVSLDTILVIVTGVSIVLAVWMINIVKDVQDLQTRVQIMEESYGTSGA